MPNYISAIKLPNGDVYQIKDNGALQLTGGQVTGPVNFGDSVYISDLNAGTLIVTGNAAFTNNIQANTINGVEVGPNPKFTDTGTVTSVAVAAANNSGITVSGSPITSVGTITIGLNLSNAINGLGEGTSPANRNDYAVVQYAGGGTSTVTYHRRKLSNVFAALNSTDITNALGGNKNANLVFAGPSSGTAATPSFRALVSADLPAGTNSEAGAVKLGASGGAATYDHAHGSLSSAGIISTSTAIASGDKFVIIDSSDSNKIKGSTLTFGNSESSFLTNKGTWGTPPNTTYSFTGGTNQFVVTPSGGTASTVTITPSITDNITGSGTSGYLVKFNGANSITTAAQLSSSGTGFLKQDGTWATPANTTYAVFIKSGSTAAAGLVPKPPKTVGTVKFLRQDASWADLPSATANAAGIVKLGASGGAATYEHTHSASLASDNTSSGVVSLSHGGQYKLTAGGSSVIFKLPSDNNTDTKVANAVASATKYYVTGTTSASASTGTQVFDTGVYVTTVAGQLSALHYSVHDGAATPAEKVKLEWNSTDSSLDFIFI